MSMFISSTYALHVKKGQLEERSLITGMSDSNSDSKTVLICNVCHQRLAQVSLRENIDITRSTHI